ncbi:MAG TPA: type III-B CRISPR module RAMP protein Cmr4 [Pyrodictiaceae archaeon]|nr:type III-B CRISPR module RAMP protein Cmr4 [Pyrodictiaceae archaeon]
MEESPPRGLLVLGMSITPLHPGVGRAPGVVDLPVARDPLGYPIILASGVKGALKALCGRRLCEERLKGDEGRIDCDRCLEGGGEADNKCLLCCCLFGPEPGSGEKGAGLLSVLDFFLLAIPVPSASHGYVYLTSPYLLKRALGLLEILKTEGVRKADELYSAIGKLLSKVEDGKSYSAIGGDIDVGGTLIYTEPLKDVSFLDEELLKGLGGLAYDASKRLVLVPDSEAIHLLERGLIRVTRVRLRIDTKTVAKGALWTEEYIPPGTLFIGGLIATNYSNEYCTKLCNGKRCSDGDAHNLLEKFKSEVLKVSNNIAYMLVGGKETIGKGLVKLYVV